MILTPLLIVFVIFAVSIKFLLRRRRFWKCVRDIPQPPAYPIIGNLFDIMKSPENMFLAERKRGREYYPIYKLNVVRDCGVSLMSPQDVEMVLTDTQHNEKSFIYNFLHGWLGTGLLTSKGSKWQRRRKILTPAFHFNILQEFIEIFKNETETLIEDLEKFCNEAVDVVGPITHFTLMSIGETAMGINLDTYKMDKSGYKEAIHDIGRLLTYRAPRPWLYKDFVYSFTSAGQKEKQLIKTLHKFSNGVIGERKKSFTSVSYSSRKRLAMLDLLLKYREEGAKINDEGIREEVDTFMFEGHDTTSMAICFTLLLLANHRDYQDEIYTEIVEILGDESPSYSNLSNLKFMERCIKESLRLYPSVPFISRIAGKEIRTKSGYTIPEGCMIHIQIFDMHHSPKLYENPEKFDPDRFLPENIQKRHPFAYVPFSAGSRNCIGQKFAMMEIKTVLCAILKKFILEPVDKPEDIKFFTDLILRPTDKINVKFVPRFTY